MSETVLLYLVLLVGTTIVLVIVLKAGSKRIGIPPLVGYLLLGFVLQLLEIRRFLTSRAVLEVYSFLAELGIISLLFRVGLECNLAGLVRQLPRACLLLMGDVLCSGSLGFATAYFLLRLSLVSSLFISIALVATSVGISISVWQDSQALNSINGELLLDIAEMDDIAAIILMSLLFAIAMLLTQSNASSATLLGISMIPRAEITMVIMQRGRDLGDWAIFPPLFAGMTLVAIATCMISPILLYPLLKQWPQVQEMEA